MGSSRFWLKAADEESKSIPHEFPRYHWLKATGQWVLERYLSATMNFAHAVDCLQDWLPTVFTNRTIGINGITNGTIGRTLNDICIPLVPLGEP